jgi:hypothetical protein
MQPYLDLNHDSGISAYESGEDFIRVWFKDGAGYEYSSLSAGMQNIIAMNELASRGHGLNTYINRHVRKRYALKLS